MCVTFRLNTGVNKRRNVRRERKEEAETREIGEVYDVLCKSWTDVFFFTRLKLKEKTYVIP